MVQHSTSPSMSASYVCQFRENKVSILNDHGVTCFDYTGSVQRICDRLVMIERGPYITLWRPISCDISWRKTFLYEFTETKLLWCWGYPAKRALSAMAGRALLAGYPRCIQWSNCNTLLFFSLIHLQSTSHSLHLYKKKICSMSWYWGTTIWYMPTDRCHHDGLVPNRHQATHNNHCWLHFD